jgi:23S rRNA (uracil1939-C5)-methyltransferase
MPYSPVDFTQVNFAINRVLVDQAFRRLDLQSSHRAADFFCGLGNFSLAMARGASQVLGFEGSQALTDQAEQNARAQGLDQKTRFEAKNLFEVDLQWLDTLGPLDRVLVDPPREGAQSLCEALAAQSREGRGPDRIVMVSCNPATLARDAAILVHQGAWRLAQAGVVNMFPQTAHVESLAVFERLLLAAAAEE